MTQVEIQCLKENVGKTVEIGTSDGELVVAKILAVFLDSDFDEHELFYELISTNMPDAYRHLGGTGGYALDFEKIVLVRPSS